MCCRGRLAEDPCDATVSLLEAARLFSTSSHLREAYVSACEALESHKLPPLVNRAVQLLCSRIVRHADSEAALKHLQMALGTPLEELTTSPRCWLNCETPSQESSEAATWLGEELAGTLLPLHGSGVLCELASALCAIGNLAGALSLYNVVAHSLEESLKWDEAEQVWGWLEATSEHAGAIEVQFEAVASRMLAASKAGAQLREHGKSLLTLAIKSMEPVWCKRAAEIGRICGESGPLWDACDAYGCGNPRNAREIIETIETWGDMRSIEKSAVKLLETLISE